MTSQIAACSAPAIRYFAHMNHVTRVYDSMLELLSNVDNPTPLVRLHRVVGLTHPV